MHISSFIPTCMAPALRCTAFLLWLSLQLATLPLCFSLFTLSPWRFICIFCVPIALLVFGPPFSDCSVPVPRFFPPAPAACYAFFTLFSLHVVAFFRWWPPMLGFCSTFGLHLGALFALAPSPSRPVLSSFLPCYFFFAFLLPSSPFVAAALLLPPPSSVLLAVFCPFFPPPFPLVSLGMAAVSSSTAFVWPHSMLGFLRFWCTFFLFASCQPASTFFGLASVSSHVRLT